ncbi:MAG: hypothetical protein AAF490_12200 [Chloroflexota bacterium]
MKIRNCLYAILLFSLLVACNSGPSQPSQPDETAENVSIVLPSPQAVPPTFTPSAPEPLPTATIIPTRPPQPTEIPATPIPFDDVVITARVRIPAVGYDRRLEGNIGSELIFVDETAGKGQFRAQQAVILIELQQALKDLVLAPVPDDCSQCIDLEVIFPLDQIEIRGWLQDPTLFASLENLFAITLGAHFSPDAVGGLRRAASPYAPSQTIEVQADGTVFIWQGNQESIVSTFLASEALNTAVSQSVNNTYQTQYAVACEGVPLETLMLKSDTGGVQTIGISCPAFTLPLPLLDLYVQFDTLMGEAVLDALPAPETGVPLTAVVQFQREDGALLLIENDGALTLDDGTSQLITDTLGIDQILSLTAPLIENETVSLGLSSFVTEAEEAAEDDDQETAVLFIRGPEGLYDAVWSETQSNEALAPLNDLIEGYLSPESDEGGAEETTPTSEPETSPTPEIETPTPSPTP